MAVRIPVWVVLAAFVLAAGPVPWAWGDSGWQRVIDVSEAGGMSAQVAFGVAASATPGIDPALGEVERPPLPPSTVLDARFVGSRLGNGLVLDLRPWVTPPAEHTLTLSYQRVTGASIRLSWDAPQVASVTTAAVIQDPFGGLLVNVDMRTQSQVTITSVMLNSVLVTFTSVADESVPGPTPIPENRPPALAPIGSRSVAQGHTLTLALSATDPDGDVLTYGVAGNPAGSVLSGSIFAWTPSEEQAGTHSVTFTVADNRGGTASESISIEVVRPPAITSGPVLSDLTQTGVSVTWTTDRASTSVVEYGPVPSYGFVAFGTEGTSHWVVLDRLVPGATYQFRVRSTASNLTAASSESTFTTPSHTAFLSSATLALDLNPMDGDQGVRSQTVREVGSVVAIQIHGSDIVGTSGFSARFAYDPAALAYAGFEVGDALPGAQTPGPQQAADSTWVEVGSASFGGGTEVSMGLLGTVRFRVTALVSQAQVRVLRAEIRREQRLEALQPGAAVTLTKGCLAGDFDCNDTVDFSDFFLFADAFGQPEPDPRFDLDHDGEVGFGDFFLFADNFGNETRARLMVLAQQYLGLPVETLLEPGYPNPFNSRTTIRYRLAEVGPVRLAVYTLTGQVVRVLIDQTQEPGAHQVVWTGMSANGDPVATGPYLVRLEGMKGAHVRKLTLLK